MHTVDLKSGQGDVRVWSMEAAPKDFLGSFVGIIAVRENASGEKEKMLVKVSSDAAFGTWIDPSDSFRSRLLLNTYKVPLSDSNPLLRDSSQRIQNTLAWGCWGRHLCTMESNLECTLIPAARVGIVHSDIRPGYNWSSSSLTVFATRY